MQQPHPPEQRQDGGVVETLPTQHVQQRLPGITLAPGYRAGEEVTRHAILLGPVLKGGIPGGGGGGGHTDVWYCELRITRSAYAGLMRS